MPFLIYPLLAAALGTAIYASSDGGGKVVDEFADGLKTTGQDMAVAGVVMVGLSVLPLTKKQKLIIGGGYSAYLIAKIKAKDTDKSVIEKNKVDEVVLDQTWLF